MSDDQKSQNNSADAVKAATETALADSAVISGEITEIAKKIAESHNILVALSSDPSVDELAAAIGASIFLNKSEKKTTVIYSGSTPNALEFLNPGEIFDDSADVLQDFVIALDKDKADHLRYKLDGDYVKVYITPYKSKIEESDLDFSYGDYNVDLVIALNVANGIDLDEALREHGRIMHDAIIINITTGKPGKFGEIELSKPKASSISEIMSELSYAMEGEQGIGKEEATAYLTGIVAATNRFSNAKTTAATMRMASRLMESGANQQLVSKNITPDVDNKLFSTEFDVNSDETNDFDIDNNKLADDGSDKLEINHNGDAENITGAAAEGIENVAIQDDGDTTLMDDLKAAEAALSSAGSETVSKPGDVLPGVETVDMASDSSTMMESSTASSDNGAVNETDQLETINEYSEDALGSTDAMPTTDDQLPTVEPEPVSNSGFLVEDPIGQNEKVIPGPQIPTPGSSIPRKEVVVAPPENLDEVKLDNPEPNRFEQMMAEALNEGNNPAAVMAPKVEPEPVTELVPTMDYGQVNGELVEPQVSATVEGDILPPPPAPEIPTSMSPDMSNIEMPPVLPEAGAPSIDFTAPIESNEQVAATASVPAPAPVEAPSDPAAFKIPGVN